MPARAWGWPSNQQRNGRGTPREVSSLGRALQGPPRGPAHVSSAQRSGPGPRGHEAGRRPAPARRPGPRGSPPRSGWSATACGRCPEQRPGADRHSCHRKSRPPSRGVAAGPRGRAHTPCRRSRNEAPWPIHRPGAARGLSAARPRDPRDPRGTPWCPWRPVRPGSLTRAGDFAQARLPPFRKAHYSGAAFRGSRTGPRPCASASPPLRTPLLARSWCP